MPTDQPNLFDHLPSKAVDDAMMILVEAFRAELDMPEVLAYPIARQGGEKALRALKDAGYHLTGPPPLRPLDEGVQPEARRSDPGVSHRARTRAHRAMGKHKRICLEVVQRLVNATPQEVAQWAYEHDRIALRSMESVRRRMRDLRLDGYLELTGEERDAQVYRITDAGRAVLG